MDHEAALIEKLRKIEALFARPGTAGERAAAASARERILERLRELERSEPAVEYRFSLGSAWSVRLFTALLRRYGLAPYRHRGQRRTTLMVKVAPSFVRETLWPEFVQANATLQQYLEEVTERVIEQAIAKNAKEPEERPATAAEGRGGDVRSVEFG